MHPYVIGMAINWRRAMSDFRFSREGLEDARQVIERLRFLGYEPFVHQYSGTVRARRFGAKDKKKSAEMFRMLERSDPSELVRVLRIYDEIEKDKLGHSTAVIEVEDDSPQRIA